MDIISVHQQGLIEQLDEEVAALAGHPRDHGQRAIVLHHLFDHSRGSHGWALAEACRALRIAAGLAALERQIERWGWLTGGRDEARAALRLLGEAIGEASRVRTAEAYRAYRLSATKALRAEAERTLAPTLLSALDGSHTARRAAVELSDDQRLAMAEESELLAASSVNLEMVDAAWAAIDKTSLRRAARRLLGDKALDKGAVRDERRGWVKVERELRNDPALPAAFRANPAQHFYALQHALAERRRQRWREACDREPDAFELAA